MISDHSLGALPNNIFTHPFIWTDVAALVGQYVSIAGIGISVIAGFVSAGNDKGGPESQGAIFGFFLGLIASFVFTFALCGGVRCLVILARAKLKEKPSE